MTTIAYDTKTLCSDSRSSMGSMIYEDDAQKLFMNVGPFAVVGIAGGYQDAMDIIAIISDFTKVDQIRAIPHEAVGDCVLLAVAHNGDLWIYQGDESCMLRSDRPFAVGSGSTYALSAIDLGKSAEEAIEYASTRDMHTNNVIQKAILVSEDELEAVFKAEEKKAKAKAAKSKKAKAAKTKAKSKGGKKA